MMKMANAISMIAILTFFSYNIQAQNIGIGTNSPLHKVHIVAADDTGLFVISNTKTAAKFSNTNSANKSNTLEIISNSAGQSGDGSKGNAGYFEINNEASVSSAIRGRINTTLNNTGASGVFGENTGTGGNAGYFQSSNSNTTGATLVSVNQGNGFGLYVHNAGAGKNTLARIANINPNNESTVLHVTTLGNGKAAEFKVDNNQATNAAIRAEVNSMFANFGTAAIYGVTSGTGGYGGLFHSNHPQGNGPAILAVTDGNGDGIKVSAGGKGTAIDATNDGEGMAIYGYVPNWATGKVAVFNNDNVNNANPVVTIEARTTAGELALFKSGLPRVNVARINTAGKAFFNGGTQVGGADLAEMFDVTGNKNDYEPGDVLVISTKADRQVEKSSESYSSLVVGVYATRPGVVLTEKDATNDDLSNMIELGVVGVIPTKVCIEGGVIKRGDLLVSSSKKAVAMKADPLKIQPGQLIGKALQDFEETTVGKIKVLVSVR